MRVPVRVLLLAAGSVGVAGLLGGDRGALVVAQVVVTAGLVAALLALPAVRRHRRAATAGVDPRRRFSSYDRVYAAVASARQSERVVDLQLRPVLARLVAGPLEERGAAAVRAALGEEAWLLVDPERPTRTDSRSGGLDTAALTRVVDRLEAL